MALETLSPDWEFGRRDDGSQSEWRERPEGTGRDGAAVGGLRAEGSRRPSPPLPQPPPVSSCPLTAGRCCPGPSPFHLLVRHYYFFEVFLSPI